jgi:hypothetical protein
MTMEKRNVFEEQRTPCRKGKSTFCDCDACKALQKQSSVTVPNDKPVSIYDVEAMAAEHK